MNSRIVTSNSLLFCLILAIGVRSNSFEKSTLPSLISKLPVDLTTEIPSIEASESKLAIYEKFVNQSEEDSDEDVEGAPPDHVVPYSIHENPEEPSTKPKYENPGDWAKPSSDIPLDFVPTKLYAQVRETHTVKRLPRNEAIKSANTEEEKLAASRLREVVSKSKTNTVYTEEGYEDAAYDHGGHIRDADFHEGYARKLEDQRMSEKNEKKKNSKLSDRAEKESETEELNEYDDDYRDHIEDFSMIDQLKIHKETNPEEKEKYKRLKNLWEDSSINPKEVTENEIEKLEEDLEKAYEESEKTTENEVPENLKKPEDDYEEENDTSEDYTEKNSDYSKSDENIDESEEKSRKFSKNENNEKIESQKNEIRVISSPKPLEIDDISTSVSPAGFTKNKDSEKFPEDSTTNLDYGKIFWDYFKSEGKKWQPPEVSTSKEIITPLQEIDKPFADEFTSVPNFPSLITTIGGFDTTLNSPKNEFSDFFATSRMDRTYPSPSSLYESWKRQDLSGMTEDISQEEDDESTNSYRMESDEISNSDESTGGVKHEDSSQQNGDSLKTLIGPKKLSYTVIIRPGERTTGKSLPCDHTSRPGERSVVKSMKSRHEEMLNNMRDQASPEAINDFNSKNFPRQNDYAGENDFAVENNFAENDFTVIRPPRPVPLRQVTYSDYLPDSYGSLTRPSVTPVIEHFEEETNVGERDYYKMARRPYENPGQNPINHETSHTRYHRRRPRGRNHHHQHIFPMTELRPPSPLNRSKYTDFLGIRRTEKPKIRFDKSSTLSPWQDIMRFYRSIDRTIFGKRRKRSLDERSKEKETSSSRSEKVNGDGVDASREKKLRPERNFFDEEANRLVAADNVRLEKSSRNWLRIKRNNEDHLDESPRIVDEVIDAEIRKRFKDEDDKDAEENDEESHENEKNRKVEIEVPDFDFDEIVENNKSQKVIKNQPMKVKTLDIEKYPFYENSNVPRSSALKYITNPRKVPKKTLGGTEFYDSRDKYRECDEVEPNLEGVLPEEEEPTSDREQRGEKPRLHGLGDKLDCFRAKYFDDDPLDNPLFLEKQIEQPQVPKEFDPAKFASRIFGIKNDEEEPQIVRRISRKPEVNIRRSGTNKNQEDRVKNRYDRNNDEKKKRSERNHRENFPARRRKKRKPLKTTTAIPELPVTPYQREVYEDVMGTIKNLAALYRTFGQPISSSSSHPDVNYPRETLRENDFNFPIIHITERPRGFTIRAPNSHHLPVKSTKLQHYRVIPYRTNKVSYRTKIRSEVSPGDKGAKVGYFRTVMVHKRSLDDDKLSLNFNSEESKENITDQLRNETNVTNLKRSKRSNNENIPKTSEKIVYTIHDRIRHSKPREISGNNEKLTNFNPEESTKNFTDRIKNKTNLTNLERAKRSDIVKPAASERIVYTIRDRFKHSKPRGISGRNGKFENLEVAESEDVRRREPRYNRNRRKKLSSFEKNPTTTSRWEEAEEEPEETSEEPEEPESSPKRLPLKEISDRPDHHEAPDEIYKIQHSTTRRKQIDPSDLEKQDKEEYLSSEDYEDEKEPDEVRKNQRKNNYDVHENVDDDITTIPSLVEPTRATEYLKLQKYLESDPPGYSEAFDEESPESSSRFTDDEEPKNSKKLYKAAETRREPEEDAEEEEEEEDDEEDDERQVERPSASYTDEESSPGSEEAEEVEESPRQSESYKNPEKDDEEDAQDAHARVEDDEDSPETEEEEHSPQIDEDRTSHGEDSEKEFDRFASRPFSPFESYEDPKYADLGPRLSKPYFYHPSFSKPSRENYRSRKHSGEDDESEEEDKEKSRFTFPWEADDEEDAEESNKNSQKIERYEYPWEKRERLARERRRKAKEREKHKRLYGFYPHDDEDEDDDEEQDRSSTQSREKRIWPWEHYKVPSKSSRRIADNEEMSSNHRPRFSSRYKSRSFNLHDDDDPIVVSSANSREIKISVLESTEKAMKNETKEPTEIPKNILQLNSTTEPTIITTSGPPVFTIASRRSRKLNASLPVSSTTPTTEIRSNGTSRRMRIWRTTSTTTIKPESASQIKEDGKNEKKKGDLNVSMIASDSSGSTTSSGTNEKLRRRGKSINRLVATTMTTATTTTMRPARRRSQKTTLKPPKNEETTLKSVTRPMTTPKVKTVEHRSRFSKEEIITKTSYPGLNADDDYNNQNEEINDRGDRKGMNERVKKVSIVMKETPDHIYRSEEIDKNGVKGMFFSITPNNGTNSSLYTMDDRENGKVQPEETLKMLKRFKDFGENKEEEEEEEEDDDPEISFIRDTYLMANLLRQVPPYKNDLTMDESTSGSYDFYEPEGSGSSEDDADGDEDDSRIGIQSNWVKDPNHRLYYYIEK